MILEEETFEAYGYYSRELTPQSHKPILAVCKFCGEFKVTTKNGYRSFCRSCSVILGGKRKGKNNPMFDTHHSEETRALIGDAMKGKTGKKSNGWQGGLKECTCLECGKPFEVTPSVVKKGYGKYCCCLCAAKARRHNARPRMTAPEKAFERICIDNNLPFKFVGNGSLWLGNANPDFIHNTRKIIVEVFGDYFHSLLLNRKVRYTATLPGRKKQLRAEGYKAIIIWESDLMRADAEAFVLHTIQKEMKKRK